MKIQRTLQTRILERFLSEREMKIMYESYCNNRQKFYRTRDITPQDRLMLKDWKAGVSGSDMVRKYKRSRVYILTSIALATREK